MLYKKFIKYYEALSEGVINYYGLGQSYKTSGGIV